MIIDIQTLWESADNDPEFAGELLELFAEQAQSELKRLSGALCGRDAAEIAAIAHKMVGSAVACGFVRFAEELRALELDCLKFLPENMEERISRLKILFGESFSGINALLEGGEYHEAGVDC